MQKNSSRGSQSTIRSPIPNKKFPKSEGTPKKSKKTSRKDKTASSSQSGKGDQVAVENLETKLVQKIPSITFKLDDTFLMFRKSEVRCRNQQTQTGPSYGGRIPKKRSLHSLIPRLINSTQPKSPKVQEDDQVDIEKQKAIDVLGKIFRHRSRDDAETVYPTHNQRKQIGEVLESKFAENCQKDIEEETRQVLLPEEERRQTLESLQKTYCECLKQLNYLPLVSDSQHVQQKKKDLEMQIRHVQEGIDIFKKPKVYVRLDLD